MAAAITLSYEKAGFPFTDSLAYLRRTRRRAIPAWSAESVAISLTHSSISPTKAGCNSYYSSFSELFSNVPRVGLFNRCAVSCDVSLLKLFLSCSENWPGGAEEQGGREETEARGSSGSKLCFVVRFYLITWGS